MSKTSEEIASQPECWERAASEVDRHRAALPATGERVAVVGCGTSWFVAQAYAAAREDAGHGETDAFAASELRIDRAYDRVVAITRSGTTTEVLDVLGKLRGSVATAVITADTRTPVVNAVDEVAALPYADERSVVQTRFATSALALLRASLGQDLAPAVQDAQRVLAEEPDPLLVGAPQLTFLGRGWTVGLAHEAALKLREAACAWTESYPALEYRHGPISIAGPGRVVWMLGATPPGLEAEVRGVGGTFVTSTADPMAELVRVQRTAVAMAAARGLDPDHPRHLTRSVILTG